MGYGSIRLPAGGAGVPPEQVVKQVEDIGAVQGYLLHRVEEAERKAVAAQAHADQLKALALSAQALAEQHEERIAETVRRVDGMARLTEIMSAAGSMPGGLPVPPARHAKRDRHGLRLVRGGLAALALPLVLARHVGAHRAVVSAALLAAAGGTVAAPSLMMGPPPPAHAAYDPDHHGHHRAGRHERVAQLPPAVLPRRTRRTRSADADAWADAHPAPVPSPHSSPGPVPSPTAAPVPTPTATDPAPSPAPCPHGNSCHGNGVAEAVLAGW